MTDPNGCHHPLITQLNEDYNPELQRIRSEVNIAHCWSKLSFLSASRMKKIDLHFFNDKMFFVT